MIRFRKSLAVAALLLIGACADPLSDVERLSDVALAEGADAASVAPGTADSAGAPPVVPGLLAGIRDGDTAAPDDPPAALTSAVAPSGGFFENLFGGGTTGPVVPASLAVPGEPTVAPGAVVPYGVLARVCGVDASSLGRRVASASGYEVFDTNPATTGPRTQYVTGFDDGCARQFNAALAIFGDIGTHELVRYSTAAEPEYTSTDRAYEAIKAAYCGVAERTPCGARLHALSQRTTFLTIYETFGTSNGWADILLSDGRVIANDF